ncbi:hypothetical protein SDC9_206393 [bioreactor metagenome]|uniref:Uncharacterized protein n=1 Tax=bioreactor metagenome TaxID=1076179 RepID=A0A645J6D3_9ZZZZ
MAAVSRIVGQLFEPRLRYGAQEFLRISGEFAPEVRIDAHKQFDRHRVPAPPDIIGKRFEKPEFLGNPRTYVIKLYIHKISPPDFVGTKTKRPPAVPHRNR